ncbi:MAG: UDP-glucose/GDP-mannose dehydrogenase family protein [Candidatus Chisholmbacteria bacterium]|nr:UDP-glucose/GDP-mannose dehydrogenase family protein [Candidatus Chisholmbacteria bacterium]
MSLRLNSKSFRICVIGPGVVGQATGKGLHQKGFKVSFWGRGEEKVIALKNEGFPAYTLAEMQELPYNYDISMFTVSTPTVAGQVDLLPLKDAAIELGKKLKRLSGYHLIVVKSTVPPGTTENLVIPLIEKYSVKKVGRDFGACMNPEFLREKSAFEDFVNSRLVLIGEHDQKSGELLKRLYEPFNFPVVRVTIKEAEIQKYVHNLFNAVKISFFNEMRRACAKIGADADIIFPTVALSSEGLWNPTYGLKNLGPFEGMCLPKDTEAFLAWAEENDLDVPILKAAVGLNDSLKIKTVLKPLPVANGEVDTIAAPEYAV